MIIKRGGIHFIIVLVIVLVFTDNVSSQKLYKYTSHVERTNIMGFENEKKRTFDKDGVFLLKKKYHPLNIVQYGILAHYNFIETGDSSFYFKCINQFKYFQDTTRYTAMYDGKGIGLPYHFSFWDLKAPWYSGMTQGYAVSYLLRYYELTKDKSVFPLVEKIIYVLLQPQTTGGTISKTPEGCTWIEEYPNSTKSPQVINGFVNGFIGLHEYCQYFPNDTFAIRIRDEAFEAVKYSLDLYDTPTWTTYNRKNRSLSNGYLRYQVYEMQHLYEIFKEPFFDYQRRIWSVLALNKPVEDKSEAFKYRNHTMSTPVHKIGDSYIPKVPKKSNVEIKEIKISDFNSLKNRKAKLMHKRVKESNKLPKKRLFGFEAADSKNVDYMVISFDDTIENTQVNLYKSQKENRLKVSKEKIEYVISVNKLIIYFPLSNLNNVIVGLKNKSGVEVNPKRVEYYNTSLTKSPFFAHFKTKPIKLAQGVNYKVDYTLSNSKNAVVFYKHSTNEKTLTKEKWSAYNTVEGYFAPFKTGFYKFMIVYDWESPMSTISEFKLIPIL